MIEKYQVHHIKYFSGTWESRKKFILVYFKDKFFSFIQTKLEVKELMPFSRKGLGLNLVLLAF